MAHPRISGFSWTMRFPAGACLLSLMIFRTFSRRRLHAFFRWLDEQLPVGTYVRFVRENRNPFSMCVMTVFSGESSSPRSAHEVFHKRFDFLFEHLFRAACNQKIVCVPYQMNFRLVCLSCVVWDISPSVSASRPSSAIFASTGEQMPPCGVPASVG